MEPPRSPLATCSVHQGLSFGTAHLPVCPWRCPVWASRLSWPPPSPPSLPLSPCPAAHAQHGPGLREGCSPTGGAVPALKGIPVMPTAPPSALSPPPEPAQGLRGRGASHPDPHGVTPGSVLLAEAPRVEAFGHGTPELNQTGKSRQEMNQFVPVPPSLMVSHSAETFRKRNRTPHLFHAK